MNNVLFISAATLTVALAPLASLLMAGEPEPGELALVVSYPWGKSALAIAESAGAQAASPEWAPMGALVVLAPGQDAAQLRAEGAWFTLKGEAFSALCL